MGKNIIWNFKKVFEAIALTLDIDSTEPQENTCAD